MAQLNFPLNPTLNQEFSSGGRNYKFDGTKWVIINVITAESIDAAPLVHTHEPEEVGLANLNNFAVANKAEAEAGTANDKYMTPLRTKEAILELSPPTDLTAVNSHIADNTIHFTQANISITKEQISNFGSYEPANANIQTHISSTNNPHSVTKTQVGLSSVENYGVATQAEAEAGTVSNKYMTPQRTAQAIAELSPAPDLSAYDSHIQDTTIHFTQSQISITESQISDFGNYEPADATILKSADIGTTVQGYNANTVIDASYNNFNPSGTYANLRAQATTAADVGLGNVSNVAQIPLSQKGANSGVAELDATGKVPSSQLPSFVDDVLEYANLAAFPGTGESGKIYIAQDTNKTYRWGGSAYVVISETLALGETSTTAYRGDRGKIAYDHSQLTSSNPHGTTAADVGAEPAFTKNTAFNKNFGSTAGTVAEGNHTHAISAVSGLQTALDGKVAKAGDTMTGSLLLESISYIELAVNQTDSGKASFGVSSGGAEAFINSTGNADFSGAGELKFLIEGSEKMRIDNDGNVGIGTTNPGYKLQVDGDLGVTSPLYSHDLRLSHQLDYINDTEHSHIWISGGGTSANAQFSGQGAHLVLETRKNNARHIWFKVGDTTTAQHIMHANGNVGIGTTSPGQKLEVNGNISASSGRIVLRDDSIENHATNSNAGVAINYYGYASGTTQFRDLNIFNGKGAYIARFVGSSGNVGIGTTGPAQKLDVAGNIKAQQVVLSDSSNVEKARIVYDATSQSIKFTYS